MVADLNWHKMNLFQMYELHELSVKMRGVEMDVPRGIEYIEKAANQGLAEAQYFATCHSFHRFQLYIIIKEFDLIKSAVSWGGANGHGSKWVCRENESYYWILLDIDRSSFLYPVLWVNEQ